MPPISTLQARSGVEHPAGGEHAVQPAGTPQAELGIDGDLGAAALERVVDERLLHRMQLVAVREPFDRDDLVSRGGDHQCQAGEHPPTVDPDRAGLAGAEVAALLAAGEVEALTQGVQQADSRLEVDVVPASVDLQQHGTFPSPRRRSVEFRQLSWRGSLIAG
jgi:hypothetical protein